MKKHTLYLLIALAISALKNTTVPEQYNYAFCAGGQTVNNLIYFLGVDLVILFLTMSLRSLSKHDRVFNIIATAAMYLAIGKVVDEFSSPYGYHFAEFIFDIFVVIWAVKRYFKYKNCEFGK